MDILKSNCGFSIIETLVTIVILGLLVIFVAIFFNQIFSYPQLFLKPQALRLATEEIAYIIDKRVFIDTSYMNKDYNLYVERTAALNANYYTVQVSIKSKDEKNLLTLSRIIKK